MEYSEEAAKKIKSLKGYTSRRVGNEGEDFKINWETEPPAKVSACLAAMSTRRSCYGTRDFCI